MGKTKNVLIGVFAAGALLGCRGEISTKPPIHIVPNMDFQQKLKAQSESDFPGWADKRGMRMPVAGTIARGSLGALDPNPDIAKLHVYKNPDGSYIEENPLPRTMEVLRRGQERFNINCAVCHGRNGRGRGIVGRRFPVKPPSYFPPNKEDPKETIYKKELLTYEDGKFFEVITTGGGTTMPPYAIQVSPADRWAIIHYIRALQLRDRN